MPCSRAADGATEHSWPPLARSAEVAPKNVTAKSRELDEEADAWHKAQSKRARKAMQGPQHMDGKNMKREDQVAQLLRAAWISEDEKEAALRKLMASEAEVEELSRRKEQPPDDSDPPVFSPGQSVLQWWAGWFKDATEPKLHYKKSQRPTWYSGEIVNPAQYMTDFKYAGMLYTGWTYPVH